MKLGIGLPNTMAHETDRSLMLDWARLADQAGFAVLGTIDKPNYDSWDPLVTLAGVAGVTERVGLATTILVLPPRNEVLVAKQAAVIDRLSDGRLRSVSPRVGGRTTTRCSEPPSRAVRAGSSGRSGGSARSGATHVPRIVSVGC
jgi:Luciferase-like monooxygenase